MIRVTIFEHGVERGVREFAPGAEDAVIISIGRHAGNDVALREQSVSGRHGEIRFEPQGVVYEDLRSTNGTVLKRRGVRLPLGPAPVVLEDGDELVFGDPGGGASLRIVLPGADASAKKPEPSRAEVQSSLDLRSSEIFDDLPATFSREALLALHRHALALNREPELGALLEQFAACLFELFPKANHVAVYRVLERSSEYEILLSRDRRGAADSWPISRTVRDRILERAEALIFHDSDVELADSQSLSAMRVRSGMCAPLWGGEDVVGFVQLDARGALRGTFEQHDLAVFATFSHQLALALRNARLNHRLRTTIAELEQARSQMERLAFYDPLTGLSNRRLFRDRLEQALRNTIRSRRPLSLLYLDLDEFKEVNDSLGHEAGDELLKAVASRLTATVREQDTVARIGGDEFTVLLVDVSGARGASRVAEKILDILSRPVRFGDREQVVTTSIGIAVAPQDGLDADALMKKADAALYRAKDAGRNAYRFAADAMDRETERHLALERALWRALEEQQFVQLFQPLVRVDDLRVVAVEALLRWRHPKRGLLAPEAFMDVAQESGLILPIGEWALRRACRRALEMPELGLEPLRLVVNVSARQLVQPDFPQRVEAILAESGIDPSRLELDIVERALEGEAAASFTNLYRLKSLGITLSLDDFGTGYASLTVLKRLPIDIIKVDRSLIARLPDDETSAQLTAATIAMAHKLGMRVAAEGVETQQQLQFLRRNQCDLAQGQLFCPPAPLESLARRLDERASSA